MFTQATCGFKTMWQFLGFLQKSCSHHAFAPSVTLETTSSQLYRQACFRTLDYCSCCEFICAGQNMKHIAKVHCLFHCLSPSPASGLTVTLHAICTIAHRGLVTLMLTLTLLLLQCVCESSPTSAMVSYNWPWKQAAAYPWAKASR